MKIGFSPMPLRIRNGRLVPSSPTILRYGYEPQERRSTVRMDSTPAGVAVTPQGEPLPRLWHPSNLYTHLLDLRLPSWSRSDYMMVAVGFNPRFAASHDGPRRGATPETWLPFRTRPDQASRRDATFISSLEPWVETHGYPQGSLRDRGTPTCAKHQVRNRSPDLWIKTRVSLRAADVRDTGSRGLRRCPSPTPG